MIGSTARILPQCPRSKSGGRMYDRAVGNRSSCSAIPNRTGKNAAGSDNKELTRGVFRRLTVLGMDTGQSHRAEGLRFSFTTHHHAWNAIRIGSASRNERPAGISYIQLGQLRTFPRPFSALKKQFLKVMRYKFLHFLIGCLLKEARGLKRKRRNRLERKRGPESFTQIFVIESFFARELIAMLTPNDNEEMHFLTGPKIGPIRIVSRCARPVSLHSQSPVFVRASARAVGDTLIGIIEQGAELHIIAHSHPGRGAGATTPSSTDVRCLGKLQKAGSQVIGCIVTRDGYVRFFSVSTKFHVMVLGTGVKELSQNVFSIASPNSN